MDKSGNGSEFIVKPIDLERDNPDLYFEMNRFPAWDKNHFINNGQDYKYSIEGQGKLKFNNANPSFFRVFYKVSLIDGKVCAMLYPKEFFKVLKDEVIIRANKEQDINKRIIFLESAKIDIERMNINELEKRKYEFRGLDQADKFFSELFDINATLKDLDLLIKRHQISIKGNSEQKISDQGAKSKNAHKSENLPDFSSYLIDPSIITKLLTRYSHINPVKSYAVLVIALDKLQKLNIGAFDIRPSELKISLQKTFGFVGTVQGIGKAMAVRKNDLTNHYKAEIDTAKESINRLIEPT